MHYNWQLWLDTHEPSARYSVSCTDVAPWLPRIVSELNTRISCQLQSITHCCPDLCSSGTSRISNSTHSPSHMHIEYVQHDMFNIHAVYDGCSGLIFEQTIYK
jgi:hypothetical protein